VPFGGMFEMMDINWPMLFKTLAQFGILLAIVYFVYNRFIRRSHAEQLIKGLFVTLLLFVGFWWIARIFNFFLLEVVFGASIQLLIIGVIVIFQPELRRMMIYLGKPELLGINLFQQPEERKAEYLIHELVEAIRFLSKSKIGALLVLESPSGNTGSYLEAGTPIDARLSTELLLTIFHPKTPLHDGAVILSPENRIAAAGVLLPLTEDPKLSWQYGTRHRAAIGLTEVTDSYCIVVSEETGNISLVHHGRLEKIQGGDDLRKRLERHYHVSGTGTDGKRPRQMAERVSEFLNQDNLLSERLQKIFARRGGSVRHNGSHSESPAPKPSSSNS
jgi:diadenylate cyclase